MKPSKIILPKSLYKSTDKLKYGAFCVQAGFEAGG